MRKFIPSDPNVDTRSIHFLLLPEVNADYFDETIERQVKRMQIIIELTRNVRDKHTLSLKVRRSSFIASVARLMRDDFQTPLKELIIYHSDPSYLEDVKPLQRYIESELNVRDIVYTSDEVKAGVKFRAVADWAVLGRKLRKDLGRVKNALPKVSSDEVKAYSETGKLTVDGIDLVEGDLKVERYVELKPEQGVYGSHTDNDVVVLLDVQIHPDLQDEWLAREMVNRVQKLRKKAGLQATDDVDVFYAFEDGAGADVLAALTSQTDYIQKLVRSTPKDAKEKANDRAPLIEEEQEIAETKFVLSLVRC